jgi:pilus assembly protein Flp/PilA
MVDCPSRLPKPWRIAAVLNRWTCRLLSFFRNEDGPTAVEYAVMLALIVVLCIAAIGVLGVNANQIFDNIGDTLSGTPW